MNSRRLRSIPEGFARGPLAEVDSRLAAIVCREKVAIGLAIESGSRAWGFPSPDRPMHFMTLMEESDPPAGVLATALELIRLKSKTRELGRGLLPPEIEAFVDREFEEARAIPPEHSPKLSADAKATAEALYQATVARLAPPVG